MKNIKKLLPVFLFALAFVACDKDDESMEDVRSPKTLVTLDKTSVSVTEGTDITFTLNIASPNSSEMDYKVEVYDAGTTASFRDFSCSGVETTTDAGGFPQGRIGYDLKVPAYATSTTFTITPDMDLLTEGSEVLRLRLVSSGTGLLKINPDTEIITINIADAISNNVGLKLEWAQDTTNLFGAIVPGQYLGVDNNMHDFADYDMDILVFDSASNEVSGYAGATGASPENAVLDSSLPNDDYFVVVDQFANGSAPKGFDTTMKLSLSKFGVWSTSVDAPFKSTEVFSNVVAIITKVGNIYTVTDPVTTNVLVTGRNASIINNIKNKMKLRRK